MKLNLPNLVGIGLVPLELPLPPSFMPDVAGRGTKKSDERIKRFAINYKYKMW